MSFQEFGNNGKMTNLQIYPKTEPESIAAKSRLNHH